MKPTRKPLSINITNAEMEAVVKYMSFYMAYADSDELVQLMVRDTVKDMYGTFASRHIKNEHQESFTITFKPTQLAAFWKYYDLMPLPVNDFNKAMVIVVGSKVHKELANLGICIGDQSSNHKRAISK